MAEDTLGRLMAEPEAVPVSFNPLRLPYNAARSVLESLMSLPGRLYGASEQARTEGTYDPGPAVEAATLAMGATPFSAPRGAIGAGPIRAYHGSPYDFERFDLSKIGTGEGAQAYGHGLYFSENPAVAADYRSRLSAAANVGGSPVQNTALYYLQRNKFDPVAARAEMEDRLGTKLPDTHPAVEAINGYVPGRMYEVNINADPAHLLDWDRPLSEQPSHVRKAIDPLVEDVLRAGRSGIDAETAAQFPILADIRSKWAMQPPTTGGELIPRLGGGPSASAALSEAGVPGIKYLDQGSRGAGAGTSNYVIFDDKLIDILRKYGLAGASPLAALMASGGEQPQQ